MPAVLTALANLRTQPQALAHFRLAVPDEGAAAVWGDPGRDGAIGLTPVTLALSPLIPKRGGRAPPPDRSVAARRMSRLSRQVPGPLHFPR